MVFSHLNVQTVEVKIIARQIALKVYLGKALHRVVKPQCFIPRHQATVVVV